MTRWVRGINEAVRNVQSLNIEDLVRLWAHEALRLFHDRFEKRKLWLVFKNYDLVRTLD